MLKTLLLLFYGMVGLVLDNVCQSIHLSTYPQLLLVILWVEDLKMLSPFFFSPDEEAETPSSGVTFRKYYIQDSN